MPAPIPVILGAVKIAEIAARAVASAAKAKDAAQAAAIITRATTKINKGSGSSAGKNPGGRAIATAQKNFDKASGSPAGKATPPKPTTPKPDAKPKPDAAKPKPTGPTAVLVPKKPTGPTAVLVPKKPTGPTGVLVPKNPTGALVPKGKPLNLPSMMEKQTSLTPLRGGTVARTMNPVPKKGTKLKKALIGTGAVAGLAGAGYALDQSGAGKGGDSEASDSDSSSDSGKTNKATPSVDKYGRKITKEEFEKREAFRKSRKAGADGKSRRVTADRAGAARKTELDRRKKFRKTKGKKKFGDAATRVTKDKSKLAAKGVRQSEAYIGRLRREAALSRRDRDFPSR